MNLPVADVQASLPFYLEKMAFRIVERNKGEIENAVLERDGIRFAIAENGGDPKQDGCAFHVEGLDDLRSEFLSNGLSNIGPIGPEKRDDGSIFDVFFVVAPDGLCYWFGERREAVQSRPNS
jgi:lactoylglutathione lyase